MKDNSPEILAPELQIALAHTPLAQRDALRIFFEADARLARIVAGTTEPMLGQMRLAWWREMLAKPVSERPSGDTVLDGMAKHWLGRERALIALVNGWEHMLSEEFNDASALAFAQGRSAPFAALPGSPATLGEQGLPAAMRWALADAASHVSPGSDRDVLVTTTHNLALGTALPRALRGLAVLDALARRSLKRGARPLMEGRMASLIATRAAIFGY